MLGGMKNIHLDRIKRALKLLKEDGDQNALVISGNPVTYKSEDTQLPTRPNSDLYYLTGSIEQELVLLLRPDSKPNVLLIAPPENPIRTLWEGRRQNPKTIARSLGIDYEQAAAPIARVLHLVRGANTLYCQGNPGSVSHQIGAELTKKRSFERFGMPNKVGNSHVIISQLRLYKDQEELGCIEDALAATSRALHSAAQMIQRGTFEFEVAASIDYVFKMLGCEVAFPTIVGSGPNAAVLHHVNLKRAMKNGEMVLIDCGAEVDLYAGDLTRVIPVGGKFEPWQRDLYQVVLKAQQAAIKSIKPGVLYKKVYDAAAREITYGLVHLGILRGKASDLFTKGAYKAYFPHGIGHSLGLDVHDVGKLTNMALKPGMVMTIEPGVYLQEQKRRFPRCGIRIEDNILVTNKGSVVLSEESFPTEIEEIEDLMAEAQIPFQLG